MSLKPLEINRIINGIADYTKEALEYSVAFLRRINYRSDPRRWTLLPKPTKESGTTVLDLPVWGERVVDTTYVYGDTGYFYTRSLAGSVVAVRQVSGSHGNGLKYYGEDGYLYYATDTSLGRYGRIGSDTPSFVDDFLGAEGGVPLNTNSMDFEATSSMSADAADSASLSITGDITLEAYVKFESLPAEGTEMVIMGKWLENGDQRSYKMVVACVSGYFGDGSDGALTIAADTTEAPIDSAAVGTSGAYTLTATNASFAAGQKVLIHQSRGTGSGTWQINTIDSYTAGTITLVNPLNYSYNSTGANKAQVRVLKQYTDVTVNSGKTYTAKAWNGTVGGILAFLASGTVTVTGTINASGNAGGTSTGGAGIGFRGGNAANPAYQGEGTGGAGAVSTAANGNGGGGGYFSGGHNGAGGGNATAGEDSDDGVPAYGGSAAGSADLTTMVFGGGGGGGGGGTPSAAGGGGGGIVFAAGVAVEVTGLVKSNGGNGYHGEWNGGGGAGGSILIKCQTATLGSGLITATAGSGGNSVAGDGSVGRIHIDYYTSYTGTTSPAIDVAQDNTLFANTSYHLRLYVSDDGADSEYYSKEVVGLTADIWHHYAAVWDASESTAYLYVDGTSIGTATGAMTEIDDGTALFAIAADYDGSSATRSFLDGLVDEVRVWNDIRTSNEISLYKDAELAGTEANIQAYYQLDAAATDETANSNDLTLRNTPTYSTDVPFSAPTTRRDIDQTDASDGDTYALATTISEAAANKQSFVPSKDPQKSIMVNVSDTGDDSDWTLTVHDALNREVASKTVAHADLVTGEYEFVFDSVWTPVIGATYHFHVTSTTITGDPKVVAGTSNNLETAQFTSYYQFLVTDAKFHPIDDIINQISIGNGRYLATYDGATYDPHRLTFPSTYKVRCLAKWREYQAIGLWRGDAIEDYDKGYVFFWDGISTTYNFYIEIPEGGVNALVGKQGTLYIVAGYKGDILAYTGGDRAKKIKRLPGLGIDEQMEILPGAFTVWQTMLRVGAGVTDSSDFEQGVYSWGALNENYPESLSYDYYISTETRQSSGVKVGMLLPVKKKLLVGWKDNVSYGLDSIDMASNPVSDGSIEFSIRDYGQVSKEKMLQIVRADFEPLASGESVGLQYKLDRESAWSVEEVEDTADKDRLRLKMGGSNKPGRHREFQVRVNLHTTTTTSPAVLGVVAGEDSLENEDNI